MCEPFDGLVSLLVAEPVLGFQGIQVHGAVVFQEIQNHLFIFNQLPGFVTQTSGSPELGFASVLGFHMRET